MGVVYNPITNELFSAVKNQGAFLNGRTLKPSGQKGINIYYSVLNIKGPNDCNSL